MSEHPLIENQNHRLLTPDESLPRIIGDTDDQLVAAKVYERQAKETVIKGLNRNRIKFNRKGKVTITMMVDDEPQDVELIIRAIPDRVLQNIQDAFQEAYIEMPERWEKEAVWDSEDQMWVPGWVQDHKDPDYPITARKLAGLLREMNYRKVIHGLDEPFLDGNTVVWDSKQAYKYKEEDAIQYLHDSGITYAHVQYIANEVDALSAQSIISSKEEFEKK